MSEHKQIEEQIEAQIQDAVGILDWLAGLSKNTTSPAHRELVEKIISAALLQTVLTQAQAISAVKGGE
jgi:hypothetical protein